MPAFISLTLAALLAAPAAPDSPARFALTGALVQAPARSADARFELEASARVDAGDATRIGRFALKSAQGVVCDTGNDIFRNGFE